jgi:hypothetical protein
MSQLRPRDATTQLCQRIVRLLKQPKVVPGVEDVYASPSTIPYALCLITRFRLACAWPEIGEDELIIMSVYTSYKFLVDWGGERLSRWGLSLEMSGSRLAAIERGFLKGIDYGVWIRDSEFSGVLKRAEMLWKDSMEKEAKLARPLPPDFVLKRFANTQ